MLIPFNVEPNFWHFFVHWFVNCIALGFLLFVIWAIAELMVKWFRFVTKNDHCKEDNWVAKIYKYLWEDLLPQSYNSFWVYLGVYTSYYILYQMEFFYSYIFLGFIGITLGLRYSLEYINRWGLKFCNYTLEQWKSLFRVPKHVDNSKNFVDNLKENEKEGGNL